MHAHVHTRTHTRSSHSQEVSSLSRHVVLRLVDGLTCCHRSDCRDFPFSLMDLSFKVFKFEKKKTKKNFFTKYLQSPSVFPPSPALFNMHASGSVLFSCRFITSFRFHLLFLLVSPALYFSLCLGEVQKRPPGAGSAALCRPQAPSFSLPVFTRRYINMRTFASVHTLHCNNPQAPPPQTPPSPTSQPSFCAVAAGQTLRNAVK